MKYLSALDYLEREFPHTLSQLKQADLADMVVEIMELYKDEKDV